MYETSEPKEFTKNLIQFYQNKIDEMLELMNTFEEKTQLGMWWDSKIPDKDRVEVKFEPSVTEFINLVKGTFTNINWTEISNKEEVLEEVQKYFNFYEENAKIAQEIIEVIRNRGVKAAEPRINFLREKLKEAITKANDEKKVIRSSTIYNAHVNLISEQEIVIGKLTSIQLEISQEKGFSLTNNLEKSEERNQKLEQEHQEIKQKNQEIEQKCENLKQENQEIKQRSQEIEQKNQEIEQQLAALTKYVMQQTPNSALGDVGVASNSQSIGRS